MGPTAGARVGAYELVRLLGRGGAGEVWEAVLHGPSGFRKQVALKLLRADRVDDAAEEELLLEARRGALLHHPNIVQTLDLGRVDGAWFVAMELIAGATVLELGRSGPLPGRAVLDIGVDTCAGLQHAHELVVDGRPAGLVHRDIKPANLLVDPSGLVKVADLGIATLLGRPDAPAGTPGYMPPEQLRGDPVDARADVFALGATLYLLAARRPLFRRGTLPGRADVEARLQDPLFDLPVERGVPGLAAVLRRCLAADPGGRWPDAAALGRALAALRVRQGEGPALRDLLSELRPGVTGPSTSTRESGARGNLPVRRDTLFGREQALAKILRQVRAPGVVALTGPGGIGKTRLALEAARALAPELPGGCWRVGAADATSAEGVCTAVAHALRLELGRGDAVARVGEALRSRGRTLLILDDLEQVVEPARALVEAWSTAAPEATLLCTSRIALSISSERRFVVGPLDLEAAASLLRDRAGRPLDEAEVRASERIAATLEGIPLALELCAARTRTVRLDALERRLADRLDLRAGRREGPARHKSLRAALDGSWDLLSAAGKAALPPLCVFEGGWTAAGAAAVLGGSATTALEELARASLVQVDERGRFSMLEVVRSLAGERLAPDVRATAEARHGAWIAQLGAPAALLAVDRRGGSAVFARLALELDNAVVACERALARGALDDALAAVRVVWTVLARRGPLQRARVLIGAVASAPGLSRAQQADCLQLRADVRGVEGDLDGSVHLRRAALEGYREVGDDEAYGWVGVQLGGSLAARGDHEEATALLERGHAWARAAGDRSVEGEAERLLCGILAVDDLDAALAAGRRAVLLQREAGHARREGLAMGTLASVHNRRGELAAAARLVERALKIHRSLGTRRHEAGALVGLGVLAFDRGALDAAEAHARAAVRLHRALGARHAEGTANVLLGAVRCDRGDLEGAAAPLAAALDIAERLGRDRLRGQALGNEGYRRLLMGELGRADELLAEAAALGLKADKGLAGAWMVARAQIACAHGELQRARGHLDEGEALLRAAGKELFLAQALCVRVEIEAREGHRGAAAAALAEAEALVARLEVGLGSRAARAVEEARKWRA